MANNFGTFKGVFVPSTEAILGTVLFLLLPTLAGDVGLVTIIGIIVISHSVTIATAFSLSDCATNLEVIGGGGMYALSKRSVGKAFGGSIGIQLYLAQAASIGFYCIGFVEPLHPILMPALQKIPFLAGTGAEDILLQKQVLSSIIFVLFFSTVMVGADFTLKIQTVILVVLLGSVVTIFLSPFVPLKHDGTAVFISSMKEINFWGSRAVTISVFFLTFTQFFPAVTGIDAGVGMSGDLANPKKSLVRGTFWSIGITFVIYLISAFIFSLMNKDLLVTGHVNGSATGYLLTNLLGLTQGFPYKILGMVIFGGIIFATGSSALSCFMTAPRTAQSLSKDNILPRFLNFLKYDFKKDGKEPRFATLVTFFIGISIIWMGNINVAATIVGICFLIVYGWVNLSAFLERISQNPTFRPTSKNHWTISLYGFLATVTAIGLFSWKIGLIILISQMIIFQLILKYKSRNKLEGVWWGVLFTFITKGLKSLNKIVQGSKNWRPIVTAIGFKGEKSSIPQLTFLAERIGAYKGMVHLNFLEVLAPDQPHEPDEEVKYVDSGTFYTSPASTIKVYDPSQAALTILQTSHPGNIKPNTILLEYLAPLDSVKVINQVLAMNNNMLLLKNGDRLRENGKSIDIWWRGERNGNLMVLLAYIIKTSKEKDKEGTFDNIRFLRKIGRDEDRDKSYQEMTTMLSKARLRGEVQILPYSEESFMETLARTSGSTDLIMMGLPGNYTKSDKGKGKYFKISEMFFDNQIEQYNDLPPIIFIKSAEVMNLIEE